MAADREKEESLLPQDYVSLAQLQKKWLQTQEVKMKLKQKPEEDVRCKISIAPIVEPRLSVYGNDRKEVTPAGRLGHAPSRLMVVKDKGKVKTSDEIGNGVDITVDVNKKMKSEVEGQRSKLVGTRKEVNGNGENGKWGTTESGISLMKAENGRIAAANRGGNERRSDIRGSRQEYRVKIDASVSKKTLESEHCERRGDGGKPRNQKPKKGIRAVNLKAKEVDTEVKLDESECKKTLESKHGARRNGGKPRKVKPKKGVRAVNEVDTEMGDEVVAVCNAIYSLTTSDENEISLEKGCQVKRTDGNNVGVKCLAGDNVDFEKDRPAEVKGVTGHDERRRVESDKFLTFTAGDVDKHPELTNENYHGKLRVGNGRNRYPNPKGNMRSRWGAHASFGRFDSGRNRNEGNSRLVWMKKGEKTIAADEGSSGRSLPIVSL